MLLLLKMNGLDRLQPVEKSSSNSLEQDVLAFHKCNMLPRIYLVGLYLYLCPFDRFLFHVGRWLRRTGDFIFEHTMNDYVASRLKHAPCTIKAASMTFLTPEEESQLRGTIASINWASREGIPDGAAAASILSGCFPNPTVKDAVDANRVVAKLKGQLITLKVHSVPEDQIRHIVIADAAFDQTGRVKPQQGWIQGVTTLAMNAGKLAPISLIGWKSRRLRRKAGSTMLCESVSLSTALGALEKQLSMWRSICFSRLDVRQQAEEDDAGGLQGAATVIALEDQLFLRSGVAGRGRCPFTMPARQNRVKAQMIERP